MAYAHNAYSYWHTSSSATYDLLSSHAAVDCQLTGKGPDAEEKCRQPRAYLEHFSANLDMSRKICGETFRLSHMHYYARGNRQPYCLWESAQATSCFLRGEMVCHPFGPRSGIAHRKRCSGHSGTHPPLRFCDPAASRVGHFKATSIIKVTNRAGGFDGFGDARSLQCFSPRSTVPKCASPKLAR